MSQVCTRGQLYSWILLEIFPYADCVHGVSSLQATCDRVVLLSTLIRSQTATLRGLFQKSDMSLERRGADLHVHSSFFWEPVPYVYQVYPSFHGRTPGDHLGDNLHVDSQKGPS